ncbi:MAG: DUF2314 domain-containing protein [bacterium]|nr:DUF2314 domain-containing protein [bacterium]
MAKLCENCGEEILGAVNVCWKCGREHLTMHEPPVTPAELEPGPRAETPVSEQLPPWCWRMEPALAAWSHAKYPDDVQVMIPLQLPATRSPDDREVVWVTIAARDGDIFRGTVINDPQKSTAIRQGHFVHFMMSGGKHPPMLVRPDVENDLPRMQVSPCSECDCELVEETIKPIAAEPDQYPAVIATVCRLCFQPQELTLLAPPRESQPVIRPIDADDDDDFTSEEGGDDEDEAEGYQPPRRAGPPLRPQYPKNVGSTGAAWASIVLAIVGALGAFLIPWLNVGQFLPIAAVIIAVLGLLLGVWGISSPRRDIAIIGSLLCLLLLLAGGFFLMVDLYISIYGHAPWVVPTSEEFPELDS